VPYFADEEEVYAYIGAAMRTAMDHPQVGPRLLRADLVIQVHFRDPGASLTIRMQDPMTVEEGGDDPEADVVLAMPADIADRFWRGDYNLAVGIKREKVRAEGDVEALLRVLPELRPIFARYRLMVARKDRASRQAL
jgi:hypothetical protein